MWTPRHWTGWPVLLVASPTWPRTPGTSARSSSRRSLRVSRAEPHTARSPTSVVPVGLRPSVRRQTRCAVSDARVVSALDHVRATTALLNNGGAGVGALGVLDEAHDQGQHTTAHQDPANDVEVGEILVIEAGERQDGSDDEQRDADSDAH